MKRLLNKILGRPETRACSTCRFSQRRTIKDYRGKHQLTICRRYPPSYVVLANTTVRGEIDIESRVRYPKVNPDDSCGEYQIRKGK